MVDLPTVRRLAVTLLEVVDGSNERSLRFEVGGKGLAWTYRERLAPRIPRRPRLDVLAVRCSLEKKDMLLDAAPERFFDDDHYRGYPAVLVRLDVIDEGELAALLSDAWRLTAPKKLVKRRDVD
jgi:hypothetical protein